MSVRPVRSRIPGHRHSTHRTLRATDVRCFACPEWPLRGSPRRPQPRTSVLGDFSDFGVAGTTAVQTTLERLPVAPCLDPLWARWRMSGTRHRLTLLVILVRSCMTRVRSNYGMDAEFLYKGFDDRKTASPLPLSVTTVQPVPPATILTAFSPVRELDVAMILPVKALSTRLCVSVVVKMTLSHTAMTLRPTLLAFAADIVNFSLKRLIVVDDHWLHRIGIRSTNHNGRTGT